MIGDGSQPSVLVQMSCKCESRINRKSFDNWKGYSPKNSVFKPQLPHQFKHKCSMPLIAPLFQLYNLCVENSTTIATVMCQLVLEIPNLTQQQQQMFILMYSMYNIQKSILGLNHIPCYYSGDVLETYHQNGKVGKVVALTSCHTVISTTEFTSISSPISATIYRRHVNLDLRALNAVIKM